MSNAMSFIPPVRYLIVMLGATGTLVAAAQEPPKPVTTAPSVTTSSSGRFIVTGPDAVKTSEYTRWAEAMAERLERRLGTAMTFSRSAPLRIHLAQTDSPTAGIAAHCRYLEGRLECRLSVNEYVPLDYEDLLAAWCRLAMVSLVDHARGRRGPFGETPRVPQWLAVGLAQTLDPALCARNRRVLHAAMPQSHPPEVSPVLSWENLPERWYQTRALCGMTVLWLDALKPQGESWRMMIDRLAAGEPVTASWVAISLAGVDPGVALEERWGTWLKRQERVVQDLGSVSSVILSQLREMVEVPSAELGESTQADLPGRLSPRDLVAMRRSASVRLVAEERMQQVQALTIGKAPELVQVGQAYALFFEGLVRGASAWKLRRRLRHAEGALTALSDLTRARESYMDAFEREPGGPGRSTAEGSLPPALDKSELEVYVDAVERRFGRTEMEKAGTARREDAIRDDHGTETDAQDNRRSD